MQIDM